MLTALSLVTQAHASSKETYYPITRDKLQTPNNLPVNPINICSSPVTGDFLAVASDGASYIGHEK